MLEESVAVCLRSIGQLMIRSGIEVYPRPRRVPGESLPHAGADKDILVGPLEQFPLAEPGYVATGCRPANKASYRAQGAPRVQPAARRTPGQVADAIAMAQPDTPA